MILLERASRSYGSGAGTVRAVEDVSLAIGAGEFVALAGPSGSGKTTLINLIGGLDLPSSGSVRLDGVDLATLSDAALAALRLTRVGFVFQEFNLVPVLSAAENVELPLLFRRDLSAAERRSRVEQLLARVGLAARRDHRPAALSGGERQRVAVARALAGRPGLVLADEPTANLDHAAGGGVIALMRELNREQGVTFLYATHDAELLGLAGRVIWLRDGRLAGQDA